MASRRNLAIVYQEQVKGLQNNYDVARSRNKKSFVPESAAAWA